MTLPILSTNQINYTSSCF